MKTTSLKDFFKRINYEWEKDKNSLEQICSLTKTRVNPSIEKFEFTRGMEQPFFVKAVAEYTNATNFFEIGTGRGTASYSVCLAPTISEITTVDIIPFDKKWDTSINYAPAFVSNKDICGMIPFPEKEKINFKHVSDYPFFMSLHSSCYDLCFIDGCHENSDAIINDFNICFQLIKDGGYIIWDDYDPSSFEVKKVVDNIASKHKFECELIEFRGHLFGKTEPENNAGEVLMKIKK
tara:strand:- start:3564 stop:4271 length:708 start_codon:yes stop_codon:yes gene_type:complete